MKKLYAVLLSTFLYASASAQGNQIAIPVPVVSGGWQTFQSLLYLPDNYSSTSSNYPLIVFLHGVGEAGYNLANIYNNSWAGGPAYFIAQNQWPNSFTNPITGAQEKFIVASPQAPGWSFNGNQLNFIMEDLVAKYRVDKNRIYLVGISAGGQGIFEYTVHTGVTPANKPAAIVPLSMATGMPTQENINTTISDNVHVWGLGSEEEVHGINTHIYVAGAYNGNGGNLTGLGALGRFTGYAGGHCCWNTYLNPNYRETINGKQMNVYEWMLQFSRANINNVVNQPPIVNAGVDQTITLPINAVNLNGIASDPDGTINSYAWTKVSGPTSNTFSDAKVANPTVTGLTAGTYNFRLTVTDNQGATAFDDVAIVVNNAPPAANKTIAGKIEAEAYDNMLGIQTAPTNDAGGGLNIEWIDAGDWMDYNVSVGSTGNYTATFRIASSTNGTGFQLRKQDGTVLATLNNPNTGGLQSWQSVTAIVPLVAGTQTLRIVSSTSNWNFNWMDFVLAPQTNQLPTANAGPDQTITLPANAVNLAGSGTDPDGTITGYSWTKISGPTTFTINNTGIPTPTVSGLVQGSYIFRLTVTDNSGGTAFDEVSIQVNSAPPPTGKAIPGKIEAEAYDNMVGVQTEVTSDAGGGLNVGWMDTGDWMDYNVSVAAAGNYTATFRISANQAGTSFQIRKQDGTVLASVPIPFTGGFQNWQSVTAIISLPAGTQTLRVYSQTNGWNFNWMDFSVGGTPNQAPVATAGTNQIITLPSNIVSLIGLGTDADGTIVAYNWTKISGPTAFTISNAAVATPVLSGLTQGTYVFRLTVTDNAGATGSADVTIQVNAAGGGAQISGKIEAENYDAMFGIQTENTNDVGGGRNVGWIDGGDWMDYNATVMASGNYTINFRVASPVAGNQFQFKKQDGTVLATLTIPATGGYQNWVTVSAVVPLQAGLQVFRIYCINSGWNINWIECMLINANITPIANAGEDKFLTLPTNSVTLNGIASDPDGTIAQYKWTKQSGPATFSISNDATATTTINGMIAGTYVFRLTVTDNQGATATDDVTVQVNNATATPGKTIPGKVEAENYDSMSGTGLENTADIGGGVNVGWIDNGDWLDYNLNVTATGNYAVNFRVATPQNNTRFQIRKADGTILATVTNPNTGGWQNWASVSATISLTAGQQVLRIYSLSYGWNFNWMEYLPVTPATNAPMVSARMVEQAAAIPVDISTKDEVKLFPNPATDKLTLRLNNNKEGKVLVQVIDLSGKVLKSQQVIKTAATPIQATVQIQDLPKGMYLVTIKIGNWTESLKFIKQ